MDEFNNDVPDDFPNLSEDHEEELVKKRLEANAKSVAKSRRIRWSLRYTILISGAIIAAAIYFEPKSELISGLVCVCVFVVFASAAVLFSMGGLAPGSTRRMLSKKQRQRLDD